MEKQFSALRTPFSITGEKLIALLALAGFLLIITDHTRAGRGCMLAVAILTILRR